MRIHWRLDETLLQWVIHSDLEIERSLCRALTNNWRFWLLQQYLKVTLRSRLEFDDIILFMIDNIDIGYMEVTCAELSHELCPVEAVGIVDPSALLIENGRFQSSIREVSFGYSWVSLLVIFLSRKESMLHFGVVNYRARIWWAVWESVLGITTKVAEITSITFVARAFDFVNMVGGGTLFRPSMRITHSLTHMLFINNALSICLFISFFVLIRWCESFLALLAITPCIWVSAYTWSIIIKVWHGVRVAHDGCLLGMGILRFKAVLCLLGLPYHFRVLRLPRWAFQIITSIILWNLGFVFKVKQ